MCDKYILDGHEPKREDDLLKWGEWMQKANRTVKKDTAHVSLDGEKVGDITISTIFLGLDHRFGEGPPILFETMVFGGPLDQSQDRCATWEGAEKMHEEWCEKVKANKPKIRI